MTTTKPHSDRARAHFKAQQIIRAEPEAIFPLLCPIREFDWIPSWECKIIYTESGIAEEGCVFQTESGEGGTDTWVISRFEPRQRVSFVRVDALRTIRYDIHLEPQGDGSTRLIWAQEITALSEEGDRHVAEQRQEDFTALIGKVEQMLGHYLKTGEALRMDYAGT